MKYTCPVCMFPQLPYPPNNYDICPCCGTEFGNEDVYLTHQQLRERWIAAGAHWFFENPPEHWNPWLQLLKAGYFSFPPLFRESRFESTSSTTIPAMKRELLVSS
jgi:hypothetical protein